MKAHITITLKPGILDPQAKTAHASLQSLGWTNVISLQHKKQFILECDTLDKDELYKDVDKMCLKLLVNTVMEDYHIDIIE